MQMLMLGLTIHKVVISGIEQECVDARDLHSVLKVSTNVNTWFERKFKKFKFVEHVNYIEYKNIKSVVTGGSGKNKRDYFLTIDTAEQIIEHHNIATWTCMREKDCLDTIEQILGINLIRQFRVMQYRIDGYDPINNIAYEIDEPHHTSNKLADIKRQTIIENILNCKFVRVKLT